MSGTLDRFLPVADVRERHETLVHAPAALVFEVAEQFPLQSIPVVCAIFWLRSKLMGARYVRSQTGLVEDMRAIGWERLAYTPGRELVMGAATQPWVGDVKFQAIGADSFAASSQPGLVKIAWTLEAEPLGPALTRFRTETRALATDDASRKKFKAYWRKVWIGIVLIRRLALAAVKKEAERRYKKGSDSWSAHTITRVHR
jgi:hypothetical protein